MFIYKNSIYFAIMLKIKNILYEETVILLRNLNFVIQPHIRLGFVNIIYYLTLFTYNIHLHKH